MIANNSVRSAISFVHLAIALFSFSFFVLYLGMEKITSFLHFVNKHEMYVMIDGLLIGCVAFYGFVTWQKDEISTSKQVSYVLVALIVLECLLLILTSHSSRLDRILVPCIPIFTAAIFMFLLTFSRKESLQNSKEIDTSNFLDIDFLIESNFKEETTHFWKMNHIFSFTCFTLSISVYYSYFSS